MHPNPGRPRAAPWLAAAALLAGATAAQAAVVVHTSAASFAAATHAPGVDDFNALSATEVAPSPLARTAGVYGYSVVVEPDTRFLSDGSPLPTGAVLAAGPEADRWLSTNAAGDTLRFIELGGAQAIGGLFFGSDLAGQFAPGATLDFLATDAQGTQSFRLTAASTGSFVGFVADRPLLSLSVSALQDNGPVWIAVNDLQLAAAVPEPQSVALLLAGLAVLGVATRRRTA